MLGPGFTVFDGCGFGDGRVPEVVGLVSGRSTVPPGVSMALGVGVGSTICMFEFVFEPSVPRTLVFDGSGVIASVGVGSGVMVGRGEGVGSTVALM